MGAGNVSDEGICSCARGAEGMPWWVLGRDGGYGMLDHRNGKIAVCHLVVCVEKGILRFDVAVDHALLVGVVQGWGDLLDVAYDLLQGQARPLGMLGAQGPVGGILHHQERGLVLETELKHAHDVGMLQMSDGARLAQKLCMGVWLHAHMEDLDSSRDL